MIWEFCPRQWWVSKKSFWWGYVSSIQFYFEFSEFCKLCKATKHPVLRNQRKRVKQQIIIQTISAPLATFTDL